MTLPSVSITSTGCVSRPNCSWTKRATSSAGSRSIATAMSCATVSANRSGGWPGIVGPDREATQMNSIACTTSIAARQSMKTNAVRQ